MDSSCVYCLDNHIYNNLLSHGAKAKQKTNKNSQNSMKKQTYSGIGALLVSAILLYAEGMCSKNVTPACFTVQGTVTCTCGQNNTISGPSSVTRKDIESSASGSGAGETGQKNCTATVSADCSNCATSVSVTNTHEGVYEYATDGSSCFNPE